MNRGALPLAILIFAALVAGVAIAIIQPGDLGKKDHEVAEPQPTATVQPSPSLTATLQPSPEPTVEPTAEPTEEPTVEPTKGGGGGGGNGGGHNGPVLADTGGAVLPWFLGGALLFAGGAALWRLRRRLA